MRQSIFVPAGQMQEAITSADPLAGALNRSVSFVVTREDTQNRTGYSLRANTFDYTVASGKVTYVRVATYDAGTMKGSTIQLFDVITGSCFIEPRFLSEIGGPPLPLDF